MITIWILCGIAIYMFIIGFMEPAKAEDPKKNKSLESFLYLALRVLWVPNRAGAFIRRLMQAVKRA